MGRHVKRSFILFFIRKFHLDRQNHSQFCKCCYCWCFINLNREWGKWNFYDLNKDAGLIDSDFRGITQFLLLNHHYDKTFTVRAEDRIAQVVFMKKFNVNFHKVSDPTLLGKTKRGHDGFGSTGVEVIKKVKRKWNWNDNFRRRTSNCKGRI